MTNQEKTEMQHAVKKVMIGQEWKNLLLLWSWYSSFWEPSDSASMLRSLGEQKQKSLLIRTIPETYDKGIKTNLI